MLQFIRERSSFFVKTLFGAIILVFIFFFGYQGADRMDRGGNQYFAKVGSEKISTRRYQMTLQNSISQMRQLFKDKIPEGFEESIRQNVGEQLIEKELLNQYAHDLGIEVSDGELAKFIENNESFRLEGKFDPIHYQENIIPYYRQRFGEDLEERLRRDLKVDRLRLETAQLYQVWTQDMNEALNKAQASPIKDPKLARKNSAETTPQEDTKLQSLAAHELLSTWVERYKTKANIERTLVD